MSMTRYAAVEFALRWQSARAAHDDRPYYEEASFRRDFFPGVHGERLALDESASQSFGPGQLADADPRYTVWGRRV